MSILRGCTMLYISSTNFLSLSNASRACVVQILVGVHEQSVGDLAAWCCWIVIYGVA
jgi:hypothetical protein